MKLFVCYLSAVAFLLIVYLMFCKLLSKNDVRYIKKKSKFLLMHNKGRDLCEKGQKIAIGHYYIQKDQQLVFEV